MGVKGLWRLLLPIGRRISIETLEGKVLAIDASIWLTQFIKAMRDPDTGSVRPAAHLIGFFRRICKLRYHGIRPVFVFDGSTPEIKLREIQQRRKRRDKLSVSSAGGDAIQRMAKRLLVQHLKKEKSGAKLSIAKKSSSGTTGSATNGRESSNEKRYKISSASVAPGFYDPEAIPETNTEDQAVRDENVDDVKNIPPNDVMELLDDEEYEDPPALEQSDWDTAIVLQQELDAEFIDEEQNVRARQQSEPSRNVDKDYESDFDADYVASLPSTQRKDEVENAKRKQRMQSRREFMQVAADPEGLSKCQLRNFLRSTKLNKSIVQMAKKAAEKDALNADQTTRRIIFEKDEERQLKDDKDRNEVEHRASETRVGRLRRKSRIHVSNDSPFKKRRLSSMSSASDESEEVEWEDGGGHSVDGDEGAINKSTSAAHPRAILDADSDGESDVGGGFLPATNDTGDGLTNAANNFGSVNVDSDQESVVSGGFFPARNGAGGRTLDGTNACSPTGTVVDKFPRRPLINMDERGSADDGGGSFIPEHSVVANDARIAQELQDEDLARVLQQSEEAHDEEKNGGGFFSRTSTDNEMGSTYPDTESASKREHTSYAEKLPIRSASRENKIDETKEAQNLRMRHKAENLAQRHNRSEYVFAIDDRDDSESDTEEDNVARKIAHSKTNDLLDSQEQEDEMLARAIQESQNEAMRQPDKKEITLSITEDVNDLNSKPRAVDHSNSSRSLQVKEALPNSIRREDAPHQNQGEESDEDVDWEDGDEGDGGMIEPRNPQSDPEKDGGFVTVDSSKPVHPHLEDFVEIGDLDEDPWAAGSKLQSIDQTAAALEHAQETASKLTNWAGRAFRRAMETHAENMGTTHKTFKETTSSSTSLTLRDTAVKHGNGEDEKKESGGTFEHKLPDTDQAPLLNQLSSLQNYEQKDTEKTVWTSTAEGKSDKGHRVATAWPEVVGAGEHALEILEQYSEKWAEERSQQERDMDTVTDEMRTDAVQLLRLFGVPFVEAPAEAEAQCVMLEKLGLVDGIVTEDSDAFAFGGKLVYKNIFDDKKYVEVYNAMDAKTDMNISHDGMIALAMLMGSDYTEGVKGVGIVNGMEILDAFDVSRDLKNGLNLFKSWLDGFDPTDSLGLKKGARTLSKEEIFHKNHHTARTRWIAPKFFPDDRVVSAYKNPVVDKSTERFSWGIPDLEGMIVFCNRHIGWNADETGKQLEPVIKRIQSGSRQTRIDSFMRYEDGIKFASVRSKRLKEVLKGSKQRKNGNS